MQTAYSTDRNTSKMAKSEKEMVCITLKKIWNLSSLIIRPQTKGSVFGYWEAVATTTSEANVTYKVGVYSRDLTTTFKTRAKNFAEDL